MHWTFLNPLWDRIDGQTDAAFFHGVKVHICGLMGRVDEALEQAMLMWRANPHRVYLPSAIATELQSIVIPYRPDDLAARRRLRLIANKAKVLNEDVVSAGWSPLFWTSGLSELEGDWIDFRRWVDRADLNKGRVYYSEILLSALSSIAAEQGDHVAATEAIERIFPSGPSTEPGTISIVAAPHTQRAAFRLALRTGDLDLAERWAKAHDHWLEWSGIFLGRAEGQLLWAAYFNATDDADRAREHADKALQIASDPRQPLALIAADRFLGQLDVDEGDNESAEERLVASLELAERCEAPFEQALTLVVMAERAAKLGEVEEARELIARVREICEPLGAKPTLQRVDGIEALLPKIRQTARQYPAGLTGREVEVLGLVARGMTDAEAAEELFISPRTVSQHLRSVYNKLGVNNRAEAAVRAVELGVV